METKHSFAFLDINPLSTGHCLVVPKKHYEQVFEVSKEELQDLAEVVRLLSLKIKKELNPEGLNILQNNARIANQFVDHVHFHIIPKYENSGLDIVWTVQEKSKEELTEIQKKLSLI